MHYNQKNKQTGFTIIELMVTILIGGILMSIAIPGFTGMQRNNCMTTSTNQMIVSLNLARSEAAKFNDSVNISAINVVSSSNEWGEGWEVWRDIDNDNVQDNNELIYTSEIDCAGLTIDDTNDDSVYVYRPDGFIDSATTIQVCDPGETGERGRQINISATGRPNVNAQFTCS